MDALFSKYSPIQVNTRFGKKYKVVAIDAERNTALGAMMKPPVTGFPSIFVYNSKGEYRKYTGDRSAQDLWNALNMY